MDKLPLEVLEHIFIYCNVQDLRNIACVSQQWNNVIKASNKIWKKIKIFLGITQVPDKNKTSELCRRLYNCNTYNELLSDMCEARSDVFVSRYIISHWKQGVYHTEDLDINKTFHKILINEYFVLVIYKNCIEIYSTETLKLKNKISCNDINLNKNSVIEFHGYYIFIKEYNMFHVYFVDQYIYTVIIEGSNVRISTTKVKPDVDDLEDFDKDITSIQFYKSNFFLSNEEYDVLSLHHLHTGQLLCIVEEDMFDGNNLLFMLEVVVFEDDLICLFFDEEDSLFIGLKLNNKLTDLPITENSSEILNLKSPYTGYKWRIDLSDTFICENIPNTEYFYATNEKSIKIYSERNGKMITQFKGKSPHYVCHIENIVIVRSNLGGSKKNKYESKFTYSSFDILTGKEKPITQDVLSMIPFSTRYYACCNKNGKLDFDDNVLNQKHSFSVLVDKDKSTDFEEHFCHPQFWFYIGLKYEGDRNVKVQKINFY